mmetsp:Transcript_19300/g.34354  ORF Transcript_19300/g.34354 Transcript_19300/m.34354 type:complete len:219 (-) Transcript_19300:46-702(-)
MKYSNYGKCIDMFAPGSAVKAAFIGDSGATKYLSGTSMSAPLVSGVMTMTWQRFPKLNITQIIQLVKSWGEVNSVAHSLFEPSRFLRSNGPKLVTERPTKSPRPTRMPTFSPTPVFPDCAAFKSKAACTAPECEWKSNFHKCQEKSWCGWKLKSKCKAKNNYFWDNECLTRCDAIKIRKPCEDRTVRCIWTRDETCEDADLVSGQDSQTTSSPSRAKE